LTYKQTLNYLLKQLPMYQRIGASAYRSDLTNIIELCKIIGNPQNNLRCIHVAGTNGKGSVTHIIASILQEQGYKVGVFVSPHYKDYRERIKINGKYISKKFVTRFVSKHIEEFKKINASFFEISTAMAFEYFSGRKVDYAIIETGMGGRLDSTNIIIPLLSVITNISYDHQQFLGNTLASIAGEKAGIIKPNIPIVIGETLRETKPVFVAKAKAVGARIYFTRKEEKQTLLTDLRGNFQRKNIATALRAMEVLKKTRVDISGSAIKKGLKHVMKNTAFIGRWMVMQKHPLIVFDSAHNEGGLRELKSEIQNLKYEKLHFVYGTVGDKDISQNLSALPKKADYYFCKADIPRGMDVNDLKKEAAKHGLKGECFPSVKKAYKAAKNKATKKDTVLVAGSVFVIAEVL
jgi:dihydrofolate synthase/folylpolyglutamate synthase